MGIPKFFRYISERYPLTSQLIEEDQIPEFDNLYLDFNGIIHNCSHPNDEDAHFRLSEEAIFTSIFTYVDHLFGKIKPKKLFFMAVDGVAPRAKMNQQRSRRFRTAKEAKEVREKALSKGEKLPDEKAFDSNCITPGTEFMARLSAQLKWFVNKKISEDSNWRDVEVVLSGHDVPGEGEHKIMEYIRLSKAQPNYNPNVRHCLYGLDADLIMLGLLSHDPHFCLLREEVKFGPASRKKSNGSLQSINFYLLHLCLMREYLDLEFRDIMATLPFDYNLERIIDDFIVLAVFVGNDFLPNLPEIHIHENGLERLFEIYKRILPTMGGYLQDRGTIDTKRLQLVLDEMALWERDIFQKEYGDLNWFKGKQAKHVDEMEEARKRNKLVLTKAQRDIFDKVQAFVQSNTTAAQMRTASLALPNTFPARERKFIGQLASDLKFSLAWDEYDDDDQNLVTFRFPGFQDGDGDMDEEEDEEGDEEARSAVERVLKKYAKAAVMPEEDADFDQRHETSLKEKMDEWKRNYYHGKLEINYDDPEQLGALVYRYIEGMQWVMHYYYSGVASWGWFYDYHYAPRISDLKGVGELKFDFTLGKPFRPFEQLMGVLPEASKELIPVAYRELMYDANSPILDFYPQEFEQDLNGKKAEWEAIVKIPFIEEKRLLSAMGSREHRLTPEEVRRNTNGLSTRFVYKPEPTVFESPLPFFPAIHRCNCRMEEFNLPTLDGLHLVPGLCEGVFLGSEALAGFPSLHTLPHTAVLGHHGINVHGSESKNKSIVVHIQNPYEGKKTEAIAKEVVGTRVFMGWPFLQEGQVVAVSDSHFKHEKVSFGHGDQKVLGNPHHGPGANHWRSKAERIQEVYSKRCGVITGDIDVLLHIRPLKGLKRLDNGSLVKEYEGSEKEVERAVQMIVTEVTWEDPRYTEKDAPPLSEEFPDGSKIFFLGEHAYGVAAQVSSTANDSLSVVLAFLATDKTENEKFTSIVSSRTPTAYYPAFKVAEMVGLSSLGLSKITSSFMSLTEKNEKVNLGLSIKFEAKSLKVVEYSRKDGRVWEFSNKAIDLIREYKAKYPEVFRRLGGSGNEMARADDIFPDSENADAKVKEVRTWLNSKGVRDFEAVSLFCDQLKKETVSEIEKLADEFNQAKKNATYRKALVQKIPREAVLKPAHAVYRLQNQSFSLGDRVTMVQDTGGVPLAARGVVIGLNSKSMDIVWDIPFLSGTTLGDRCSPYRGSTTSFDSCLNLTTPQFVMSTKPNTPHPSHPQQPFQPRFGPRPAVTPGVGQQGASGFRPNPNGNGVHIMTNPNRGRGGPPVFPGRGRALGADPIRQVDTPPPARSEGEPLLVSGAAILLEANGNQPNGSQSPTQPRAQGQTPLIPQQPPRGRGGFNGPRGVPRGGPRGGFAPGFARGRGGFVPDFQRGRGGSPRGGFPSRGGRGRGGFNAPVFFTPRTLLAIVLSFAVSSSSLLTECLSCDGWMDGWMVLRYSRRVSQWGDLRVTTLRFPEIWIAFEMADGWNAHAHAQGYSFTQSPPGAPQPVVHAVPGYLHPSSFFPMTPHAAETNIDIFNSINKSFIAGSFDNYRLAANKLATWLNDARAYYGTARPSIVLLIETAHKRLIELSGHPSDVPFNIANCPPPVTPWRDAFRTIIDVVRRHAKAFVEPDLFDRLQAVALSANVHIPSHTHQSYQMYVPPLGPVVTPQPQLQPPHQPRPPPQSHHLHSAPTAAPALYPVHSGYPPVPGPNGHLMYTQYPANMVPAPMASFNSHSGLVNDQGQMTLRLPNHVPPSIVPLSTSTRTSTPAASSSHGSPPASSIVMPSQQMQTTAPGRTSGTVDPSHLALANGDDTRTLTGPGQAPPGFRRPSLTPSQILAASTSGTGNLVAQSNVDSPAVPTAHSRTEDTLPPSSNSTPSWSAAAALSSSVSRSTMASAAMAPTSIQTAPAPPTRRRTSGYKSLSPFTGPGMNPPEQVPVRRFSHGGTSSVSSSPVIASPLVLQSGLREGSTTPATAGTPVQNGAQWDRDMPRTSAVAFSVTPPPSGVSPTVPYPHPHPRPVSRQFVNGVAKVDPPGPGSSRSSSSRILSTSASPSIPPLPLASSSTSTPVSVSELASPRSSTFPPSSLSLLTTAPTIPAASGEPELVPASKMVPPPSMTAPPSAGAGTAKKKTKKNHLVLNDIFQADMNWFKEHQKQTPTSATPEMATMTSVGPVTGDDGANHSTNGGPIVQVLEGEVGIITAKQTAFSEVGATENQVVGPKEKEAPPPSTPGATLVNPIPPPPFIPLSARMEYTNGHSSSDIPLLQAEVHDERSQLAPVAVSLSFEAHRSPVITSSQAPEEKLENPDNLLPPQQTPTTATSAPTAFLQSTHSTIGPLPSPPSTVEHTTKTTSPPFDASATPDARQPRFMLEVNPESTSAAPSQPVLHATPTNGMNGTPHSLKRARSTSGSSASGQVEHDDFPPAKRRATLVPTPPQLNGNNRISASTSITVDVLENLPPDIRTAFRAFKTARQAVASPASRPNTRNWKELFDADPSLGRSEYVCPFEAHERPRALGVERGIPNATDTLAISFTIDEEMAEQLGRRVEGDALLRNAAEARCLSLACYAFSDALPILAETEHTEALYKLALAKVCTWPRSGKVWGCLKGSDKRLMLSPPFDMDDGLVDLSSFVLAPGQYTLEIIQQCDASEFLFVLYFHLPTARSVRVAERRAEMGRKWAELTSTPTQPFSFDFLEWPPSPS